MGSSVSTNPVANLLVESFSDLLASVFELIAEVEEPIEAITLSRAHPSGTYQEVADEIFVGSWGDLDGTFELNENYTAKFRADTPAGYFFGRCEHPIVAGSGTNDFQGVSGRLDFKDDPETGTAAYTGHLRFD